MSEFILTELIETTCADLLFEIDGGCSEASLNRLIKRAIETAYKKGEDSAQQINQLADDWLPIESAPRDGTKILVSDGVEVDSAYYDYDEWCAPHSAANPIIFFPTHWQPLPKPPSK